MPSNADEYVSAITRASPPVAVTGMSVMGVALNDWVIILTLIYLVMQMGWFVYSKFIRKAKTDGSG